MQRWRLRVFLHFNPLRQLGKKQRINPGAGSPECEKFRACFLLLFKVVVIGGFKHEVQHGITIDETPLQAS